MRKMRIIVLSAIFFLLTGCRVKEAATVERISTSTHSGRVLVDSIAMKDSIVIRERCDTVFFTKYRTLYKERMMHDTVVKCDTVYCERMVTVKEKTHREILWLLLLPLVAVLWKVGVFDLLRKLILKK